METTIERNKAVVRALFERCINPGRLDLLPELVSDDYVSAGGEAGVSGFEKAIAALRAAFPDIRYTVEDLVAEGDRVVVRSTWRGTHTGVFRGFAPSHASVTDAQIAILELKEGRIVRQWLQTDRLGFLQQIGVLPSLQEIAAGAGPTARKAGPHRCRNATGHVGQGTLES